MVLFPPAPLAQPWLCRRCSSTSRWDECKQAADGRASLWLCSSKSSWRCMPTCLPSSVRRMRRTRSRWSTQASVTSWSSAPATSRLRSPHSTTHSFACSQIPVPAPTSTHKQLWRSLAIRRSCSKHSGRSPLRFIPRLLLPPPSSPTRGSLAREPKTQGHLTRTERSGTAKPQAARKLALALPRNSLWRLRLMMTQTWKSFRERTLGCSGSCQGFFERMTTRTSSGIPSTSLSAYSGENSTWIGTRNAWGRRSGPRSSSTCSTRTRVNRACAICSARNRPSQAPEAQSWRSSITEGCCSTRVGRTTHRPKLGWTGLKNSTCLESPRPSRRPMSSSSSCARSTWVAWYYRRSAWCCNRPCSS
mmetsp:Transcript_58222/g.137019  ORF Transcript_58222/g.137019 Transcript_58222/m.137019 type:complete len:361 (+) Transcript_58222:992-2074(+)